MAGLGKSNGLEPRLVFNYDHLADYQTFCARAYADGLPRKVSRRCSIGRFASSPCSRLPWRQRGLVLAARRTQGTQALLTLPARDRFILQRSGNNGFPVQARRDSMLRRPARHPQPTIRCRRPRLPMRHGPAPKPPPKEMKPGRRAGPPLRRFRPGGGGMDGLGRRIASGRLVSLQRNVVSDRAGSRPVGQL